MAGWRSRMRAESNLSPPGRMIMPPPPCRRNSALSHLMGNRHDPLNSPPVSHVFSAVTDCALGVSMLSNTCYGVAYIFGVHNSQS